MKKNKKFKEGGGWTPYDLKIQRIYLSNLFKLMKLRFEKTKYFKTTGNYQMTVLEHLLQE